MVSKFKDIFTLHSLKISYSNSIYCIQRIIAINMLAAELMPHPVYGSH